MNDMKEKEWKRRRMGIISASELKNITSASGKIIDSNIDYIRHKRFERLHGFNYPVSSRYFDIGHEQEPYIIAWYRAHHPEVDLVYSGDCEEIPFWRVGWAKFGASPDAFTPDHKHLVECKCLCGNSTIEFFADPYTPMEAKRAAVIADHGAQLMGQFLSDDAVEKITLVKYIYQDDDCDDDTDSPLADWRGYEFDFVREDFDLESMRERIIMFDQYIDLDIDPAVLKKMSLVKK